MYEFWYDYVKPKYNDNVRLCYMDTDSFVMNIKTNDFYKDIFNDAECKLDTSNYITNRRQLPIGKNKKVIGLMKDELGGEIITEFTVLRPKTYSYLTDNYKIDKKAKGTRKCTINKMIKFNDYKFFFLNNEVILKSQQRFISKKYDVYTENVNKIALSNDDDKKILSNDKITTYPYGYMFECIKMLNLDNIVNNKNTSSLEDNNWPFRTLIIGPSGSGKTNTLLHLINNLYPIDKIYLYAKDIYEPKYEYLINKREQAGIKNLNDLHAFIEYSDDMNDALDDINNYNKNRDKKVLIVFDDMIADIEYNKKFRRIIKDLFYRACKINVSIVFITQSYFKALKDARLNSTHYILMRIGNKKELKKNSRRKIRSFRL